jgi:hypothetical protein
MTIDQSTSRKDYPPSTVTWQTRLEASTTEREILAVVREFTAQFSPHEIQSLPPDVRPGKFVDANDVKAFAFEIVRHESEGTDETAALVHKMAAFFSNASIELSEILGHSSPGESEGGGDSRQSA